MWGLFTRALTLASSTVRVSVINTSANFVITALLGAAIFKEKLPGLLDLLADRRRQLTPADPVQWWFGAALLVAGSVIIGQRDEGNEKPATEKIAGPTKEVAAAGSSTVCISMNCGGSISTDRHRHKNLACEEALVEGKLDSKCTFTNAIITPTSYADLFALGVDLRGLPHMIISINCAFPASTLEWNNHPYNDASCRPPARFPALSLSIVLITSSLSWPCLPFPLAL